MRRFPAITLILLGAFWLLWAAVIPWMAEKWALNDAGQFEKDLRSWLSRKVQDQKLTEEDVQELFSESRSLQLGGENPTRNFQEMIRKIARSSAPPWWLGAIAIVVGVAGLRRRKEVAQ